MTSASTGSVNLRVTAPRAAAPVTTATTALRQSMARTAPSSWAGQRDAIRSAPSPQAAPSTARAIASGVNTGGV